MNFKKGFLKGASIDRSAKTTSSGNKAPKTGSELQADSLGGSGIGQAGASKEVKPSGVAGVALSDAMGNGPSSFQYYDATLIVKHSLLADNLDLNALNFKGIPATKDASGHGVAKKRLQEDYTIVDFNVTKGVRDPPRDDSKTLRLTTLPPRYEEDTSNSNSSAGFTDVMIYEDLLKQILDTPDFPSPPPKPPGPGQSYTVVDLPGRGMSVVATRSIKAGELILAERPLVIVQAALNPLSSTQPKIHPGETQEQMLTRGYDDLLRVFVEERMDPGQRDAFMGLWNAHEKDGSGPYRGRVRTNGWGLGQFKKHPNDARGQLTAICDEGSRFNHSCVPNATRSFETKSLSFQFRTLRDIVAGEELTVTYVPDLTAPTEKRQEVLRPYGFTCTCRRCLDPSSHKKLLKIVDAMNSTATLFLDEHFPGEKLLALALRDYDMFVKEGLEETDLYYVALEVVIAVYQMLGDLENAMKFGKIHGRNLDSRNIVPQQFIRPLQKLWAIESFHTGSPFWKTRAGREHDLSLSKLSPFLSPPTSCLNLVALIEHWKTSTVTPEQREPQAPEDGLSTRESVAELVENNPAFLRQLMASTIPASLPQHLVPTPEQFKKQLYEQLDDQGVEDAKRVQVQGGSPKKRLEAN